MSTLRLSVGLLILMLILGLVGCSSTAGLRQADASKIRTVASIGDRPLPIVTGAPGNTLIGQSEPPEPEGRARAIADGRISGRVVDGAGKPVPNAQVRLAVNSSKGGRVVSGTTDGGGGFTLRGVRPGTSYTVIAESEDSRGSLTGRSTIQAPDTDVRIALSRAGDEVEAGAGAEAEVQAQARAEPRDPEGENPARVSPVSRRDVSGGDDAEAEDGRSPKGEEIPTVVGSPINVEDLPPAPEADAFDAPAPRRKKPRVADADADASSSATATATTTRGAQSWRRGDQPRPSAASGDGAPPRPADAKSSAPDPDSDVEPVRATRGGGGGSGGEGATPDEDGPNPLPPALEPGQASRRSPRRDPDPDSRRVAAMAREEATAQPETMPGALVGTPPSSPEPVASAPPESPAGGTATPTARTAIASIPPPADLPPAAEDLGVGAVAGRRGPTASVDDLPPPADLIIPAGAAAGVASGSPTPARSPAAAGLRPRPRWRDVSAGAAGSPPTEDSAVGSRGSGAGRGTATSAVAAAGEPDPDGGGRGSPGEPAFYCRFDAKHRRIDDFRLPDSQGRPVRFRDFDADLILLDFWGTWCQPCLRSVPQLVDLQKRRGGKQLQVVGIACERDDLTPAQRSAGVAQAARKLGINYPVLVSSLEGDAPLQQALHVQAYPTLILVDRQGRILWQDQGATKLTMSRLDHMLNLATKSDSRRRY